MKQLSSVLLLTLFISTSSFTLDNSSINKEESKPRVEIIFNRHTGFTELLLIKAHLEKKSIILDYKKIEFNKKGELIALSFTVNCQDGFSGSASTDNLTTDKSFGFYRDYSKGAESPFGTGNLK
jgi:hypothetical protein